MAEAHVISALVDKRSEVAGLLIHHQKEIERLASEVKTLEAAIKLFEPDYELEAIKAKQFKRKNSFFKHGECSRMMLNYLRIATTQLSTQELTLKVIHDKRLQLSQKEKKALQMTIYSTLSEQSKKGCLAMHKAHGQVTWSIKV